VSGPHPHTTFICRTASSSTLKPGKNDKTGSDKNTGNIGVSAGLKQYSRLLIVSVDQIVCIF
jgi:hypothetical protein